MGDLLVSLLLRVIVQPVALVICTPFVLARALLMALSRKQKFIHAAQDGYWSVSHFCERWVF